MSRNIPAKIIKENSCVCGERLQRVVNKGISNSTFDQGIKNAVLIPCHKHHDTTSKSNYRAVSLLPSAENKLAGTSMDF